MTHADCFQTLAEIGLGFAGLAAPIGGMRQRSKGDPALSMPFVP